VKNPSHAIITLTFNLKGTSVHKLKHALSQSTHKKNDRSGRKLVVPFIGSPLHLAAEQTSNISTRKEI
jgi:hypothetical protein